MKVKYILVWLVGMCKSEATNHSFPSSYHDIIITPFTVQILSWSYVLTVRWTLINITTLNMNSTTK